MTTPATTRKIPFPRCRAELSCGHEVFYRGSAPKKGDYVPCTGCDGYSHVIQVTQKGVVKQ